MLRARPNNHYLRLDSSSVERESVILRWLDEQGARIPYETAPHYVKAICMGCEKEFSDFIQIDTENVVCLLSGDTAHSIANCPNCKGVAYMTLALYDDLEKPDEQPVISIYPNHTTDDQIFQAYFPFLLQCWNIRPSSYKLYGRWIVAGRGTSIDFSNPGSDGLFYFRIRENTFKLQHFQNRFVEHTEVQVQEGGDNELVFDFEEHTEDPPPYSSDESDFDFEEYMEDPPPYDSDDDDDDDNDGGPGTLKLGSHVYDPELGCYGTVLL